MQLEVPADQYEDAINSMKKKIEDGNVPGITDPEEAEKIVKKGQLTYEQAKNLTKAGNIDSLKYDATNGAIIATSAMGISFVIDFVACRINGLSIEESLKESSLNGLKVGSTVFAVHVISSQIAKTGVKSALVPTTDAIANALGNEVASSIATTCGENVAGLSSAQVASKVSSILQGQIIVDAVIVVVLSAEDVYDLMNGRISSEQLLSNLTVTVTTVASGTAGYYVGGAIGSAIAPGVGTAVGAVAGSMVMGFAGGYIADKVVDKMYKSDAEEMFEIIKSEFEKLSVDYLITEEEGNAICDELSKSLTEDVTKDMYASDNREEYAASLMRPLFEEQITNRTSINIPTMEQVREEMLNDLEGIVFIH